MNKQDNSNLFAPLLVLFALLASIGEGYLLNVLVPDPVFGSIHSWLINHRFQKLMGDMPYILFLFNAIFFVMIYVIFVVRTKKHAQS